MFELRSRLLVGYIRINQPVKYQEQYECAAWYENRVSETGVFPLYLETGVDSGQPVKRLAAELPSVVTDDYFQSLNCGMPIGKPYDSQKNAGKTGKPIKVTFDCVAGIEKHGNTPCENVPTDPVEAQSAEWLRHQDVYFRPEVWSEVLDWAQDLFKGACHDLRRFLAVQGSDEWVDRMIAHCGREADKWHKAVDAITRHMGYRGLDGSRPLCDISKNLAWVPSEELTQAS